MRKAFFAVPLAFAVISTSLAAQSGVGESLYTAYQAYKWWEANNSKISKAIGGKGEGFSPAEPGRPMHFANLSDEPVTFSLWSKRCGRHSTYTLQPHKTVVHSCNARGQGERFYRLRYNGRTRYPVGFSFFVFERAWYGPTIMVDRSGPARAQLIRLSHRRWGGTG